MKLKYQYEIIKYLPIGNQKHTLNLKTFNTTTTMQTRSGRNIRAPVNEYTDRDYTPGSGFIGADHYDRAYGGGNLVVSVENESSLPNRYDYDDEFLVDSQEELSDISLTEDEEDEESEYEETESESETELDDDEEEEEEEEEEEDEMSDDENEDEDAVIHPELHGFETPPPTPLETLETPPPTPPRLERQNACYYTLPIPPLVRSNHHIDEFPQPIELFPENEVLETGCDSETECDSETKCDSETECDSEYSESECDSETECDSEDSESECDSETEYDSESEYNSESDFSESDFESDERQPIVFNITFNIDSVHIQNLFASAQQ